MIPNYSTTALQNLCTLLLTYTEAVLQFAQRTIFKFQISQRDFTFFKASMQLQRSIHIPVIDIISRLHNKELQMKLANRKFQF